MTAVASHLVGHDSDVKPFAKSAGGKTKLLPKILDILPKLAPTSAYFEPFVGGGALFFALQPKKAFLGDANPHLITTYIAIRDDVEKLIRDLQSSRYSNTELNYYRVRKTIFKDPKRTPAEFIYANRVGFNGLFRVNSFGKFNTPFGKYKNPTICNADNLRRCARALCNAHIRAGDFVALLKSARKGDIVYADPPYWPASDTANFRGYTAGGFGPTEQVRLRDEAKRLKKLGVFVLLSNADVPAVRELYKGFKLVRVQAPRSINSVGTGRGNVGELLIY